MDALESLLEQITPVASQHGMDAYIVGSAHWVPATYEHDGYLEDGRLLKLSPTGVPSRPILEIELNDGLRLYRHKDSMLTRKYKGGLITSKWVHGFIASNAEAAQHISRNPPAPKHKPEPPQNPAPYTQQELEDLHKEQHEVRCSCRGMTENCGRCYGSGRYAVDGLGIRI